MYQTLKRRTLSLSALNDNLTWLRSHFKIIGYSGVSASNNKVTFTLNYDSVTQGLLIITGQCNDDGSATYFTMTVNLNSIWNNGLLSNQATNGTCGFDAGSKKVTVQSDYTTSGINWCNAFLIS